MTMFDCTKEPLLAEYLDLLKNPKHGTGSSVNPCKDCKIFIFQQGKQLMDELGCDILVTGEVMGQRPMSQMKKALQIIKLFIYLGRRQGVAAF